jgi:MFS family permease
MTRDNLTRANGFFASPTYLLVVFTLVNAVNWADRQVMPILFPAVRTELGLTDTQLGVIGGVAFSVIYAVASFGFGRAADYGRRTRITAFGLLLWSVATAAGGLATGFLSLFAARFFIGVGEASLYPCAMSLLAERYPAERRGRAMGIFGAAAAAGGGLGVALGGVIAESYGWRTVFYSYGAVGLLLLLPLFLIHDPSRKGDGREREPMLPALRSLVTDGRLLRVWAAGTVMIAAGIGYATWIPSFFVRERGLDVSQAGYVFGASILVGGTLGSVVGGHFADVRRRLRKAGELDVSVAAAALACPLVLMTLAPIDPRLQMAGAVLAPIAIYAFFPSLQTMVVEIAPPQRLGIAYALQILFLGGVGQAAGPFIVGLVSDRTGSLLAGLFVPLVLLGIAALLAVHAGSYIRRYAPAAPQGDA